MHADIKSGNLHVYINIILLRVLPLILGVQLVVQRRTHIVRDLVTWLYTKSLLSEASRSDLKKLSFLNI